MFLDQIDRIQVSNVNFQVFYHADFAAESSKNL